MKIVIGVPGMGHLFMSIRQGTRYFLSAYSGSNLCSIISSILELVKELLNFNLLISATIIINVFSILFFIVVVSKCVEERAHPSPTGAINRVPIFASLVSG